MTYREEEGTWAEQVGFYIEHGADEEVDIPQLRETTTEMEMGRMRNTDKLWVSGGCSLGLSRFHESIAQGEGSRC